MRKSQEIEKLAEALAAAQGKFKPVERNQTNTFHGYKYADLQSVIEATREALTEHGLALTQGIEFGEGGRIKVICSLLHKSGQWLETDVILRPKSDSAQEIGSALTYARRYGISALLSVAPDHDDDGNAAQGIKPGDVKGQKPDPKPAKPDPKPARPAYQPQPQPQPPETPPQMVYSAKSKKFVEKLEKTLADKNLPALTPKVLEILEGKPMGTGVVEAAIEQALSLEEHGVL